mgnify:CR=1 FL=1
MKGAKIPVVSGVVVNKQEYLNNTNQVFDRLKFMKFPLVLKPLCGGSSIGLFVAKNRSDFEECIVEAFEFDENILVEKFISGAREFNIAAIRETTDIKNFMLLVMKSTYDNSNAFDDIICEVV